MGGRVSGGRDAAGVLQHPHQAQGAVRTRGGRARGHLHVRADRLLRAPPGARPRTGGVRRAEALAGAPGTRGAVRDQRDRRGPPGGRRRRGRGQARQAGADREARAHGGGGEVLLGLFRRHGAPERAAAQHRAASHGPHNRAAGADAGTHRARRGVRAGRQRLLRRLRLGGVRQALGTRPQRTGGGRARGGSVRQGRPARLRALEARRGRPHHAVAQSLGAGFSRLAHRVHRHGHQVLRGRVRHPRRWPGPRLPAPRGGDRAGRGRWQGLRALLDALEHDHAGGREDGQEQEPLRDARRPVRAVRPARHPLPPPPVALPQRLGLQRGGHLLLRPGLEAPPRHVPRGPRRPGRGGSSR